MASLLELHDKIQQYDTIDNKQVLKGISYDLTSNEGLGFDTTADFHVNVPYKVWPKKGETPPKAFDSALGSALEDVLKRGLEASTQKDGQLLIDIAQLAGGWPSFFCNRNGKVDKNDQENWAYRLAKLVNNIPEGVTPVIRILTGQHDADSAGAEGTWAWTRNELETIFWPNGRQCIFTHAKAEIYFGFYSPSFEAARDKTTIDDSRDKISSLIGVIRGMATSIKDLPNFPEDQKKQIEDSLASLTNEVVIKKMLGRAVDSVSWNHAKILAVNGKTLLTGGGIYCELYADNVSSLHDLQAKVKGDAAVSAHAYCNYFWEYLNREHRTDTRSFRRHVSPYKPGKPAWDPSTLVPIFSGKPTSTGKVKVLTTSKLGDWIGKMDKLQYPIQAVDGIRDFMYNLIFRRMWATDKDDAPTFRQIVIPRLNDRNIKPLLDQAGITAAAWASRIARYEAITAARSQVYIDAAAIACWLHKADKSWNTNGQPNLDWLNEQLKLKGKDQWDGVIWAYDMLDAIVRFMIRVGSGKEASGDPEPLEGEGVFILLSSPVWKQEIHKGWQDEVPAFEFKQRMRAFCGRMGDKDEKWDEWFNKRCHFHRVSNDGTLFNHTKTVCCDKSLLYVGSDNMYPNYNEEHGIWIDDKDAINAWYDGYWKPRWDNSFEASMDPNASKNFPPTML